MSENNNDYDSLRLTFAAGIIATFFAYLSIRKDYFKVWLPPVFEKPLLISLGLSGVLSFLFIMATAAKLKYNHAYYMGRLQLSNRSRRTLYDLSVDIIEIMPECFLGAWFLTWIHQQFHKPITLSVVLALYLIGIVAAIKLIWVLIMFLLSQVYAENRATAPKVAKVLFWSAIAIAGFILNLYNYYHTSPNSTLRFYDSLIIGSYIGVALTFFKPFARLIDNLLSGGWSLCKRIINKARTFNQKVKALIRQNH